MQSGIGMRVAGILCAVSIGGGLSVFLLGPFFFDQVPIHNITTGALVAGICFAAFGAWLFLVSCVAPLDELRRVLHSFQAGDAVVLFLPYMLIIGTWSIWRAMVRGRSNGSE